MKERFSGSRCQAVIFGALAVGVALPAAAAPFDGTKPENWGISVRNTIGSPVGELREGMSSRLTATGTLTKPPFGTGSLGLEVSVYPGAAVGPGESKQEKVDFGNEVDFFGDPISALNQVGFHVFQTNENVTRGGPTNMPNIRFEIDPPGPTTYSTMVWVPGPAPVVNQWSPYIDATTNGAWYFTEPFGSSPPPCNQAAMCTFGAAKAKATGGTILSVLVGKGRDNMWIGAVDGLRLNNTIYDFEEKGVKSKGVGHSGDDDDDDDDDD
jgi:hypothetical protein